MIREQIQKALKRQKMTPYRLAKISGLPRQTIYNFLNHKKSITDKNADKICEALDLDLLPKRK